MFSFRKRIRQRHSDIALLFFVLLVKKQIEKSLRRKLFSDEIVWQIKEDLDTGDRYEGLHYERSWMN